MSAFTDAVQDLADAADSGGHAEIGQAAHGLLEAVREADRQEATWALAELVDFLADPQYHYHALIACVCEPIMRQGGDPWGVAGLLIERFRDALRETAAFQQKLRERCEAGGLEFERELRDRGETWEQVTREHGLQSYLADTLELMCLPALPIIAHCPEARRMLRAWPTAVDHVCQLSSSCAPLGQIARVLESHAPDELAGSPDEAAGDALKQLAGRVVPGGGTPEEVSEAIQHLIQSLFCVELAVRNRILKGLGDLITNCGAENAGILSQLCGSLVETGSPPRIALPAILSRLPEVLALAGSFVGECRKMGGESDKMSPEQTSTLIDHHGPEVARRLPLEARAFQSVGSMCLGAIAMLSRAPSERQRVRLESPLLRQAAPLSKLVGPVGFLCKMLRVVDDEPLLVLVPELVRGWRVRAKGIADNFQLHTLLAGALVGPESEGLIPAIVGLGEDRTPVPGRPLAARAAGAARSLPCTAHEPAVWSQMQLWNWQALRPDGRLPENPMAHSRYFIWGEGVPDDISHFDGIRFVLIGSATLIRSWNGGRIFHGMRAELTPEESLSREAVEGWLQRLASAPR
jgi:hypothetical protein